MLRWFERPNAPAQLSAVCGTLDVAEGSSSVVTFGRDRNAFELIVVRDGSGGTCAAGACVGKRLEPIPLDVRDDRIVIAAGAPHVSL